MQWKWQDDLNHELFQIRKYLHQYPELSFQEYNTQAYICYCLEYWGIPYWEFSDTGVVVDIWGEETVGQYIALRADIDALPIKEQSGVSFISKHKGVMHACGHDGHTTILLGAIYHLWNNRSQFNGMIRCIFQPGEESSYAARKMIDKGVLKNPDIESVVALHLWPNFPFGSIGIRRGTVTAACNDFKLEIIGEGGHAARPHKSVDAIAIGNEVVNAMKFLTTKCQDPVDPIVIHVGKFQGGEANNAIADKVVIEGTIRTISRGTRKEIKQKFIQLVTGIVEQYGGKVNIDYRTGHPAVINDSVVTGLLEQSAEEIVGTDMVHYLEKPSMGADDFGYFSEVVPSTYFRLGIKQENQQLYDLHHPKFYFNDDIIPVGSMVFTQFAINYLNSK